MFNFSKPFDTTIHHLSPTLSHPVFLEAKRPKVSIFEMYGKMYGNVKQGELSVTVRVGIRKGKARWASSSDPRKKATGDANETDRDSRLRVSFNLFRDDAALRRMTPRLAALRRAGHNV